MSSVLCDVQFHVNCENGRMRKFNSFSNSSCLFDSSEMERKRMSNITSVKFLDVLFRLVLRLSSCKL